MYADDIPINFNLEDFTRLNIENEINVEIEKINICFKVVIKHAKDKINDFS